MAADRMGTEYLTEGLKITGVGPAGQWDNPQLYERDGYSKPQGECNRGAPEDDRGRMSGLLAGSDPALSSDVAFVQSVPRPRLLRLVGPECPD